MIKDFQPYSNLWLTTHNWKENNVKWMNDPWETLDANYAEKFVEDAVRTLQYSCRYFKDRSHSDILKIAEKVR